MRVAFVYTGEARDRCYVTRPDGTTATFHPSTYGKLLPHDLAHLCVERALGLRHGFWGLLADGVDFADLVDPDEYRRTRRKVRGMAGRDTAELHVAEAAVGACSDLPGVPVPTDDQRAATVTAAYRAEGLEPPPDLAARLVRARADAADLLSRWVALEPGGHVVEELPLALP